MAHRSIPPPETDAEIFEAARASSLARLNGGRFEVPSVPRSWVVGAVGLLALAAAGWWLLRPAPAPIESSLPLAPAAGATTDGSGASSAGAGSTVGAASPTTTEVPDVVVQAAGQVARPGVYRLPPGSRIDDLVDEAGGFTRKADTDRVNLAAPLVDGERVWVPATGEQQVPPVVAGGGSGDGGAAPSVGGTDSSKGATPTDPVDLNSATAEELDSLPGVGPATAAAILAYRDQHGPFRSVDDLLDVRGIGDAKLEQLRPMVRV